MKYIAIAVALLFAGCSSRNDGMGNLYKGVQYCETHKC